MLSVIIPSRNQPDWKFTQRTVDDLFDNAEDEIEVICVLDGYELNPPLKERKNLIVIHNHVARGMRQGINAGAAIAKGKYIMKCDDHCAFGQGYDKILAENCDDDWLAVPSRYALDGEKWCQKGYDKNPFKYGPIEYLYLTYAYNLDEQFGFGFHGKKWLGNEGGQTGGYFDREKAKKDILIDDMLTFQGSCWFMPKKLFERIGGMQIEGFYQHQEAQEMGFKVWLSGGRCVINKKTWYAHLHKGDTYGRGYHLLKHQMIKSAIYSAELWLNNKWPGQTRKFKWLIEHPSWWPLDRWPEDWDDPKHWFHYDYEKWHKSYEIQQQLAREKQKAEKEKNNG